MTYFGDGNQQKVMMAYQGIRKGGTKNGAEISGVSLDGVTSGKVRGIGLAGVCMGRVGIKTDFEIS